MRPPPNMIDITSNFSIHHGSNVFSRGLCFCSVFSGHLYNLSGSNPSRVNSRGISRCNSSPMVVKYHMPLNPSDLVGTVCVDAFYIVNSHTSCIWLPSVAPFLTGQFSSNQMVGVEIVFLNTLKSTLPQHGPAQWW